MKVFFDTEFTGLHKNTTLISIGLVDEYGRAFYAEFDDYDKSQVTDWIKENVIKNLKFKYAPIGGTNPEDPDVTNFKGSKDTIRSSLLEWLKPYDKVEFVSDVCHYDFVLLIDLLVDSALDLPENLSANCIDLNTIIALMEKMSDKKAFDYSREELVQKYHRDVKGDKHNSLYDARVIKEIYQAYEERDWLYHINLGKL